MADAIQKKLKAEVEKYSQMQKGRCRRRTPGYNVELAHHIRTVVPHVK